MKRSECTVERMLSEGYEARNDFTMQQFVDAIQARHTVTVKKDPWSGWMTVETYDRDFDKSGCVMRKMSPEEIEEVLPQAKSSYRYGASTTARQEFRDLFRSDCE